MDPDRVSSHSMREGCATTLYANGVDPVDIQRWGRWKSPVYMRYVWNETVRLRTLSYDLAEKTDLSDHALAHEQKNRRYLLTLLTDAEENESGVRQDGRRRCSRKF